MGRDTYSDNWPAAKVQHINYDDAHPDGKANVFVQWKGTEACLDFVCECGRQGHFDGFFAYTLRCECGAVWEMPSTIYPRRCDGAEFERDPVQVDMGDDGG